MQRSSRPTYEYIVVGIVILLTIALAASLYAKRERVRRGELLAQELSTLRAGIQLYRLLNHEIPPSLEQLARATYTMDNSRRPYLQRMPRDEGGHFIDPFGNPYRYDVKMGWVRSTTPDFARW